MVSKGIVIASAIAIVIGGLLFFRLRVQAPTPGISPTPTASAAATKKPSPRPAVSVTVSPVLSSAPSPTATPTTMSSSATPTPSVAVRASYVVTIHNFAFDPTPLTVTRGDTVTFRNTDQLSHSVTSLNAMFDSKTLAAGSQWVLDTSRLMPGTYEYRSTLHPSVRGTLIIR